MSESCQARPEENVVFNRGTAVPAARLLTEFTIERIGENVVLFDDRLDRYHTINEVAFDIWRQCDGVRSADQIADSVGAQRDTVEAAVEQLGEAGMLDAPESAFESTMHRRRVVKLAAAGVLGALAIPVVQSITLPDAASAATGRICPDGKKCPINKCCCCHPLGQGGGYDNCDCSCDVSGADCSTPGLAKTCVC